MGRPELGSDPRYATYVARSKHQREVHQITEDWTRAHTRAEIVDKLVEVDVPVASILNMKEVVSNEYLRERGALWDVDDGFGGKFTLPANSAWMEKPQQPLRIPRLGEQRNDVMHGVLGLSDAEIARFERAGAFGAPKPSSHQTSKHESDVPTVID